MNGIIFGVCVMAAGDVPDRGQFVDGKTLGSLLELCRQYANGVKVRADHGSGIFSTAGILRNFRVEGGALRADLHILSTEENKDKLLEMADEIPDTFGLSVDIEMELEDVSGKMCIRPTNVFSVDIVTDPAACPNGLFSQQQKPRRIDAKTNDKMTPEEMMAKFAALENQLTAFNAFMTDCAQRFTKYDAAFPKAADPDAAGDAASGDFSKFEAALKATRESFDKKLEENSAALVAKVAAEFSKVIGTVVVKAAPAGDDNNNGDEKPEAAFEKSVQAEFEKTGSKTKAMAAAIKADMSATGGKGYAAFIKSGKTVKYSK